MPNIIVVFFTQGRRRVSPYRGQHSPTGMIDRVFTILTYVYTPCREKSNPLDIVQQKCQI